MGPEESETATGSGTTAPRAPEAPEAPEAPPIPAERGRGDRGTTHLRVRAEPGEEPAEPAGSAEPAAAEDREPEEAAEAGNTADAPESGGDGEDEAPAADGPADASAGDGSAPAAAGGEKPKRDAGDGGTTQLRVPAETDETPAAADDQEEPEKAPKADNGDDDGTTQLRVPAQAGEEPKADSGDRGTTQLRAPADGDEDGEAAPRVDQPTSVLRLPEDANEPGKESDDEAAPRVDQPTSVLRLPEQRSEKPADPRVAPPTPSPDSKAVPLRPADPPRPTEAPEEEPRDPLVLLAALTNKPAPPPTPLRTLLRRIKIWTPLVVLLLVVIAVAQWFRPLPEPSLELTAAPTFTFDGEAPSVPWPTEGQSALEVEGLGSFGSSGEQEPVPIASVAKVMTAYVILQEHPMGEDEDGETIPVDQLAEDEAGLAETDAESTVPVEAGSTITQREALQAIMIPSANNVARLLARWDSESQEAFVEKMNAAAADLGMDDTTYTDPSGLDETTVSTADDQVLLAKAAMDDPVFRQIARMPSYEDSQGTVHGNWNGLVPVNGVVGIKTGTSTAAGGNLMFAAHQQVGDDTRLIVGAVLDQGPDPQDNSILVQALNMGDQLIRFAQDQLTAETVIGEGEVVGHVDDGLGGRTPVVVTEEVQAVGWAGLEVSLQLNAPEDGVPGSADAGAEVGTLTVGDGPDGVTVPLALGEPLGEPGLGDRLLRIL
ncbi:D-alanyl-D-alanine carboxypeptidase [Streptomyces radicis]|uniref:D-alanyl-D-alanine carboxypeptidase n=1 Tax=Streptomyces radicis TaxID=1750517 RepID=UPI001E5AA7A9|nr:D-alanyl-D-alanine carboxypeptidase [Streptomyces radicis]